MWLFNVWSLAAWISISVGSIANCYPAGSSNRSLYMADVRCLPGESISLVYSVRVHLIKSLKLIENTKFFFEDREKEMTDLVRCSPSCPCFPWKIFLAIAQRVFIPRKTQEVTEYLTKFLLSFPKLSQKIVVLWIDFQPFMECPFRVFNYNKILIVFEF